MPVMFRMKLGRLRRMVGCVVQVALRGVSVVSRSLMVASFVMLRRLMMMLGGMFMVLCCFAMVFSCFLRHIFFSFSKTFGPLEAALSWLTWHEKLVNIRVVEVLGATWTVTPFTRICDD